MREKVTKLDLIEDLQNASEKVDGSLTVREYREHGEHSYLTLVRRFDSFNDAKRMAGLSVNKKGGKRGRNKVSEEEILNDLRKAAGKVEGSLTMNEYAEKGTHHAQTVQRRFGTFNEAKEQAGLETPSPGRQNEKMTVDELVEELNAGKSLKEIADEYDYKNRNTLSNKLRKAGYGIRNTVNKNHGAYRKKDDFAAVFSVSNELLNEKGVDDADKDYFYSVEPVEDERAFKITIHEDKVYRRDESGETD